jgi:ketose-bisphosphate aldolase
MRFTSLQPAFASKSAKRPRLSDKKDNSSQRLLELQESSAVWVRSLEFASPTKLLQKARKERYAIPGFLAHPPNFEHVKSILDAAEAADSPVILQANEEGFKYAGLDYVVATSKVLARRVSVPVVLHLDHGSSFELAMRCICSGFSSVMVDGSSLPFEKNIEFTRKVVQVAHAMQVPVEAELGELPGEWQGGVWKETTLGSATDSPGTHMTTAEDASRFCEETGADALAISVGTGHGVQAKIDFDRLREIEKKANAFLVLHGGSGIPDDALKKAIEIGISKVTYWTTLRKAFVDGVKSTMTDARRDLLSVDILNAGTAEMENAMKHCMTVCGSSGKS